MTAAIRDATAADLGAIERIETRCFPLDPWSRGMLREELDRAGGVFVVAHDSGRNVLGFAIGWRVLDEVHVLQVAVDPDAQRSGLGRRLVEALHAAAPHAELAWLEVRCDNGPAIALYEGLGYAQVARRPRYYGDGTDCLVMRCDLRAAR